MTTTFIIKKSLLAFALCGSLLAGSERTHATSVTVRFAELNLNTEAGARALYARIQGAAQKVCGTRSSAWDHRRTLEWKECYRATIDSTVSRIGRPMLTAVHRKLAKAPPG